GRASPEGYGTGDGNEDATQGNEFLALLFDWLYNDMTADQRAVMINSLEWRTDHIMNTFSFRTGRSSGAMIRLTFRSDNQPQTIEAEDFDLSGSAEIIEHEKASGKKLVELAGEDARLETTVELEPAEYILEVAGYGPSGAQDAFYVSINDGPPERMYINDWGKKITRFKVEQAGTHTVAITADPNEIGMTIDRVTVRVHEDHRLKLPQTEEWSEIDWDVPVPSGATNAVLEFFNYYAGGNVWWSQPAAMSDGENLLTNTALEPADDDTPADWRFHPYSTESTSEYDADGGPDDAASVGIICPDSTDRGSWGQTIAIGDQKTINVSGWYRTGGLMLSAPLKAGGMAGMISSHPYESGMDTAVCGLALAGHSDLGDEWFEVCLNYLIGINCGHGFDQAWNEGAGYGTSKCKWLANATMYYDTALPEANLGLNPFYDNITDWFSRVIPVGMDHHCWGNQRNASRGNHLAHFRKFAYLTGDGTDLLNWQEYGGELFRNFRPWIEYVLPGYYEEPVPEPEETYSRAFDIDGWAMAASGPPSLGSTYEEGTGVIFQCRPRGGYGHSFNSDGSVQLHAYGQMLNHGGGSSANKDAFAYHTMSHNTILVDGLGQAQPGGGMLHPTYGHICGYEVGDNYVYFSGDVTRCYPEEPGRYSRWGLPMDSVYERRALPYLESYIRHVLYVNEEYFILYDDLQSSQPATYTWLYHIMPEEPFEFDPDTFTCRYTVGDVPVLLKHIYRADELRMDDRRGEDGLVNPVTGEDYREFRIGDILSAHHLWVSNEEPAEQWRFLSVVYPQPPGGQMPAIEALDDNTVRVGDDVICFDPSSDHAADADIVVEVAAFRAESE
ncbi:MAG: heparinase II/III family protein, partial [Armatimonadota bacterium]